MMILNLTPGFCPMILPRSNTEPRFHLQPEEVPFTAFTFPGGEEHIRIDYGIASDTPVTITTRLQNSGDLMRLILATDALRRKGVRSISARLPYIPYGRQDRVAAPGEPLSIAVIARLINSCNFDSVQTYDPHSDVTAAVINNCSVGGGHHHFLAYVLATHYGLTPPTARDFLLVVPDAGAIKRAYAAAKTLGLQPNQILQATKHRNVQTGEITDTTVQRPMILNESKPYYVIYDDICDGGRTFIEIAKAYSQMGVERSQMILVVSHGIFSKGLEPLHEHFGDVFSTDSFPSEVAIPFHVFANYRYDR